MYAYFKGTIISICNDNLILEVNHIGYNIKISAQTARLLPEPLNEIKIYTYTCVKEDSFLLYGFLTMDELELFKKMINVNGIGPKGALAILSFQSVDELRLAIISGDAKAISRAPGIGLKTAERLILDLKDKVDLKETLSSFSTTGSAVSITDHPAVKESIEALVALGYMAGEATKAVRMVPMAENMTTQELLKQALKNISAL